MPEIDVTKGLFDPAILDLSDANIDTGDTYTSAWRYCGDYKNIYATVYADQVLQVHLEFSNNGADIDAISNIYDSQVSVGDGYDWPVMGRYVRMLAANASGVNTTTCRLRMQGKRT